MTEHYRAVMEHREAKSAVAKHHATAHLGLDPTYWSKILDVQPKNLNRLASEALHLLRNGTNCCLLNNKGEFGKMTLPRLSLRDHPMDMRDHGVDPNPNGLQQPPRNGPYHQWDPNGD